ncbi:hypothetical protein GOV11_00450, partial [Candidatus Woesearchaeota archaeon]|nr:hypothetical protein [Candidatus Woesearchaeota archaeon]
MGRFKDVIGSARAALATAAMFSVAMAGSLSYQNNINMPLTNPRNCPKLDKPHNVFYDFEMDVNWDGHKDRVRLAHHLKKGMNLEIWLR